MTPPKPAREDASAPVEAMDELTTLITAKRQRLIKVAANVVLFSSLLVGPYVRGYLRSRALVRSYAEVAACVYGGVPAEAPGLGMPNASESYFAARLSAGHADFPKRCIALLEHELVPAPATFIFPSVKRAEADLADVRDMVLKELRPLALHVPASRVPLRPLRAMDKLRAVVAEHTLAGGMLEVPSAEAVDFRKAARFAVPTRVPLYAQSDSRITFSGHDTELTTVAVDGRGVSYVSVGRGGMDQRRTPRPKLLEAFLSVPTGGAFVWAMPQNRCKERENGCSLKAMGIGQSSVPWTALPEPRWLGAHPAGRVDRSVWLGDREVLVLAELAEGLRGVRRFEFDLSVPPESADMPPLKASAQSPLRFIGDGQLLARSSGPAVVAAQRVDPPARGAADKPAEVRLVMAAVNGVSEPIELARAPFSKGSPWVIACEADKTLRFAWGDEAHVQAGYLPDGGAPHVFEPVALRVERPVDLTDHTFDHVRVPCVDAAHGEASRVRVLARDDKGRVHAFAGEDGTPTLRDTSVATDVRGFEILPTRAGLLMAFAGVSEGAQVRVLTLDARGDQVGAVRVPAACFSPAGGMCGTPLLARAGERIVLSAREGTDLLALESVDDGVHFVPLRGLGRTD